MKKRWMVWAAALMMSVHMAQVVWAGGLGSLEITLRSQGQPIAGAELSLFRVGEVIPGGYRLTDDFGGGRITELDAMSPELAVFLSQKAAGGAVCQTNAQGMASFQPLEEGLYLVAQKDGAGGCAPLDPFLVILPWDGHVWDISVAPHLEPAAPLPSQAPVREPAEETAVLSEDLPADTSDPGSVLAGAWGINMSAAGILLLLTARQKKRQR